MKILPFLAMCTQCTDLAWMCQWENIYGVTVNGSCSGFAITIQFDVFLE